MWLEKSESVLPSVSRGYAQGDAARPLCPAQRPPSQGGVGRGGAGWGGDPAPGVPRDQSRNLAFSGNRPALQLQEGHVDLEARRLGSGPAWRGHSHPESSHRRPGGNIRGLVLTSMLPWLVCRTR